MRILAEIGGHGRVTVMQTSAGDAAAAVRAGPRAAAHAGEGGRGDAAAGGTGEDAQGDRGIRLLNFPK